MKNVLIEKKKNFISNEKDIKKLFLNAFYCSIIIFIHIFAFI